MIPTDSSTPSRPGFKLTDVPGTFVGTPKGGLGLIHEGYRYRVRSRRPDALYWCCSVKHCTGKAVSRNGAVVALSGHHHHPPPSTEDTSQEPIDTSVLQHQRNRARKSGKRKRSDMGEVEGLADKSKIDQWGPDCSNSGTDYCSTEDEDSMRQADKSHCLDGSFSLPLKKRRPYSPLEMHYGKEDVVIPEYFPTVNQERYQSLAMEAEMRSVDVPSPYQEVENEMPEIVYNEESNSFFTGSEPNQYMTKTAPFYQMDGRHIYPRPVSLDRCSDYNCHATVDQDQLKLNETDQPSALSYIPAIPKPRYQLSAWSNQTVYRDPPHVHYGAESSPMAFPYGGFQKDQASQAGQLGEYPNQQRVDGLVDLQPKQKLPREDSLDSEIQAVHSGKETTDCTDNQHNKAAFTSTKSYTDLSLSGHQEADKSGPGGSVENEKYNTNEAGLADTVSASLNLLNTDEGDYFREESGGANNYNKTLGDEDNDGDKAQKGEKYHLACCFFD